MLSYLQGASVAATYDLGKINREIHELENDIYEYEEKIVALRRSLVLKRAEYARKAVSALSLPVEILSMVFLFCR